MQNRAATADLVVLNGRIYTLDRERSWAKAAAVKGGRFIAVGEQGPIESLIGQGTQVVDLAGKMAMPGIVDVHTHMMMGGQAELFELRFPPTIGLDEIA